MKTRTKNLLRAAVGVLAAATMLTAGAKLGAPKAGGSAASVVTAQQRAFAAKVDAINAVFMPKLDALEQRGEELNLATLMSAPVITSESGRAGGRTAVGQMRQMLVARSETVRLYHHQLQQLLTPELEQTLGAPALDQLRTRHAHAERINERLQAARLQYDNAVETVLTWATQQGDTLQLRDGKISMESDAQIAQLNQLFSDVNAAAAEESTVAAEMAPVFQQFLQEMARRKKAPSAR